ncbi:hypothetical protein BDZ97DRAFT_1928633 [Flammula alnicola]|nr:hypothetical protein BDZ97DRAFT_1928633 [Flammula alnicola]
MGTIKDRDLSFFFSLLNEQWTRIRSLYVYIDYDISKSNGPGHRLGQPNQYLEFFDVYFRGCPPQSLSAPRFLLFSDRAPSLRKFHHHNLHFTLQVAWLCHIRCLKMEDLTVPFTASELIEAFTRMPLLEVLDVYTPESPLENNPNLLPYPNLPRLIEFRLSSRFEIMYQVSLPSSSTNILRNFSLYVDMGPREQIDTTIVTSGPSS